MTKYRFPTTKQLILAKKQMDEIMTSNVEENDDNISDEEFEALVKNERFQNKRINQLFDGYQKALQSVGNALGDSSLATWNCSWVTRIKELVAKEAFQKAHEKIADDVPPLTNKAKKESIYRMQQMTKEEETKKKKEPINWDNLIQATLFFTFVGAGITAAGVGVLCEHDTNVRETNFQHQKVENEKNGPCQDIVYQLGAQPDGKILCHKDADLIVNHAVVECRCRK